MKIYALIKAIEQDGVMKVWALIKRGNMKCVPMR